MTANPQPWLHRFACILASATFLLIVAGASVTSHRAGLSVPDWPTTYGQFMFSFPTSKWVATFFTSTGIVLSRAWSACSPSCWHCGWSASSRGGGATSRDCRRCRGHRTRGFGWPDSQTHAPPGGFDCARLSRGSILLRYGSLGVRHLGKMAATNTCSRGF